MSKHAFALQKALPEVDLFAGRMPARLAGTQVEARLPHTELAVRLFENATPRCVIAFTSVHPSAGLTTTVRALAAELVHSGHRVAILDGTLRPVQNAHSGVQQREYRTDAPVAGPPHAVEPSGAQMLIADLRNRYDCILIDCGSLATSVDLLRLASVSDGVVVVVEADKTAREEVERAIHYVRDAHGTLLGFVFNKRRYPIPNWLYRRL
jgi:Mrp family chromosome partitioning ATPase